MPNKEKTWAVNMAFTGDKEQIQKFIKQVEKLEEQGHIKDFTMIDGPFDSLRAMLKSRTENLGLLVAPPPNLPQQINEGRRDEIQTPPPEPPSNHDNKPTNE